MKATFEFTLPDEESEYKEMEQGPRACSALRELSDQLRAYVKYGTDEKPTWERFRDMVWEACQGHEVHLD